MSESWKVAAERQLMSPESLAVYTTAMLHSMATSGRMDAPSPATFARWVASLSKTGKLREVVKGVYLNPLGHRDVSPAAAAHWVRHDSVVSLAWVLEQAHVTNNFGDTVTCVIPTHPDLPTPNVGDRMTKAAPFRFFAMPMQLVSADRLMARSSRVQFEDVRDVRFDYPRTTPEKALLDWIFLGSSHRSRMTRPPFDLQIESLSMPRLRRLANAMSLMPMLDDWLRQYEAYQASEDVRENSATRMRF
jgi:hypothetical protein